MRYKTSDVLRLLATSLATTTAFINPIIPGFNPDPTITRVGEDYFLATSSFEFFPGCPIYHSKDLINWTTIGHALNRRSQLDALSVASVSGGIYAPTLRHHNGTFYLTTTNNVILPPDTVNAGPRSFYVSTKDIFNESTWSEPTYIDQPGIDPDLFWDDDGTVYMSLNVNKGVSIAAIDLETGDALTTYENVLNSTAPCPLPQLAEGPHLYKINGTYYMITAEVGTEAFHQARIYRSQKVWGPWEPSPTNPLLFNGRDTSQNLLATGHADMVEGVDGKWWAVFLASRHWGPRNVTGWRQLGRETYLTPVEWRSDGWPTFNNGELITENMPGHLYDLPRPPIWRDDFNSPHLIDHNYYHIRTPTKPIADLTSRPGFLRLGRTPYQLTQRTTPSALLRKQTSPNTTFTTLLTTLNPHTTPAGTIEAGASIYLNDYYHHTIALTISPRTNLPAIRLRIASGPVPLTFSPLALQTLAAISATTCPGGPNATTPIPSGTPPPDTPETYTANVTLIEDPDVAKGGAVRFSIEAREEGYRLGYGVGETGEMRYVGEVGNRWLDAAPLLNFVGAHWAVYFAGDGAGASLAFADFDYVMVRED